MKTFEKWWLAKNIENIQLKDEINFQDIENAAEKGWRAAFEKINSWLWLANGQVVNEIKARIKKELEE